MPKIQFKRGIEAKLPILNEGEPGFTTDTKKLFIGGVDGNVQFAKQADLDAHTVTLGTKANQSDLDVANTNIALKANQSDLTVTNANVASNTTSLAERAYQLLANQYSSLANAISELNVGTKKILFIPDGTYSISSPLTISGDNIDVQLAPNAKIVNTVSNINTFIFTGKNCSLNGGTIEYPVAFDGTNRKWEDYEAVVLVKGDGFRAKNVTLNNIYKVGFGIRDANDCIISNNKILGNYPASSWTGVETAHFGVAFDPKGSAPDGNILIQGNIIKSCIQGAFIGNFGAGVGYGINISNNVFEGCHNHGIYSNGGEGTTINANTFNRCALPIAILGKFAIVTNNNIYTSTTGNGLDIVGISVREAINCNVSHNTIKGDAPNASTIIALENLSGDPTPNDTIVNNIISHNIIETTGGSVVAIRVGNASLNTICKNNQVKNNIIKCNGRLNDGIIEVLTKSGFVGMNNQVTGNTITLLNNCFGIYTFKQRGLIISDNTIKFEYSAASAETITMIFLAGIEDTLISRNSLRCESDYGTNVTLRGILEDATSTRNLVSGNLIKLDPTLLTGKTEIFVNASSKSVINMINGVYVA